MIFFEVFNYLLLIMGGGIVIYYLLISLFAFRRDRDNNFETVKSRKFAVILFIQEKEQVLSRSLYSLSGLVYHKNKYDLIVIADNYTDSIVQVAEKMGAKIIIPPSDKLRGDNKNILPWVFAHLLEEEQSYDAITVFNSDGLVSGNYLEVMNYYLEQGSEIIQGSYKNLHTPKGWIDKICEMNFLMDSIIYPQGRKALGLGTNIRSNGMCFSTSLLHEFPWKEGQQSINEYGLSLRLHGIEIDFAPEAVVYTEILTEKWNRNSYLNTDSYQLLKKYAPQLLRSTLKTKSLKYINILFELISPRFVNMVLFVVAMSIINAAVWWGGWVLTSPLLLWLGIMGLSMISVFISLIGTGSQNKFLKSAFYIPINVYVKAKGLIQRFLRKEKVVEGHGGKDNPLVVTDENQPVK